jgi:hypothetical protein
VSLISCRLGRWEERLIVIRRALSSLMGIDRDRAASVTARVMSACVASDKSVRKWAKGEMLGAFDIDYRGEGGMLKGLTAIDFLAVTCTRSSHSFFALTVEFFHCVAPRSLPVEGLPVARLVPEEPSVGQESFCG